MVSQAAASTSSWAIWAPIVGILVTAVGSVVVAHFRASGNVRNTDADKLWAEQNAQREALIVRLDVVTNKLDTTTEALNANREAHLREMMKLQTNLEKCIEERTELRRAARRRR